MFSAAARTRKPRMNSAWLAGEAREESRRSPWLGQPTSPITIFLSGKRRCTSCSRPNVYSSACWTGRPSQ